MEKVLKQIMDEAGTANPDEKIIPRQKLVVMSDSNETLRIPRTAITSPDQCVQIFRQIFRGSPIEMAAVISLSAQMEFLNAAPVAWGTVKEVHVSARNLFTEVLCRSNAAYFILGHNHPSGSILPSEEDFKLLREMWRLSWIMDCPMRDFMILGDGTDDYYSHRDVSYVLENPPAECHCDI